MIAFPDISPEIISFSIAGNDLAIRWYAVSYLAGFLIATVLMRHLLRRDYLWRYDTAPMDTDQVDSMMGYLVLAVIVGGRLGYVLFYNLESFMADPGAIIRIWDGGMAFHGGFLGVAFAALLFCRFNGLLVWSCADLLAIASGPGILFGRAANFINAELWGRPTNAPWGVVFPGGRAQDCPSVIGECARHPSQLYEAGLEGLLLFLVLITAARFGALRRPGTITGMFLLIYGSSRYFVEFYRVPDPQFFSASNLKGYAYSYGELGITMGQFLSLPMICAGLLLIAFRIKKARMV